MVVTETECSLRRQAARAAGTLLLLVATGCAHKQPVANYPAPPPPSPSPSATTYPEEPAYPNVPPSRPSVARGEIPATPMPPGGVSHEDKEFILTHRPIYSQVGEATWYRAPYKGRKAANGEVFDGAALTAAHRTLPMGSLIVVTNLETRQASAMRISDRGPFVPGKIIDLTEASAKSIGIFRAGTARVRIDVYETPKPINRGGRWCVQIGAFTSERRAEALKLQLERRYPESHVIEFSGERTYWVRIRPEDDSRTQAEYIATHVHPAEGEAYLTRLD